MREYMGTIVGVAIVAVGLTGLGVALAQMMTHANPNGTMLSLGGLAVFLVTGLVLAYMAR